MVELWQVDRATEYAVQKREYYYPKRPEEGVTTEYDITSDHYLKKRPEFKDLMDDLDATFASGASEAEIKKYSKRYENIYNRQRELETRLTEMQKADPEAWKIALNLITLERGGRTNAVGINVKTGEVQFIDSDLKSAIAEHLKGKKEQEISNEQSSRFYELRKPAMDAVEGMKAEGMLAAAKKEASKRGFRSRNQMWQRDLEAMRKFRDEVGVERFRGLTSYDGETLRDMFGK